MPIDDSIRSCAVSWKVKTVKLLLEYKVDIHAGNEYPLMFATSHCSYDMTRLLLDSNAEIYLKIACPKKQV
jgi:ankyrin repeat protein